MTSNGFEFYAGATTDSHNHARITVRRGGVLVLTQATVQMLGDGVTSVQVGYNPKTRAVGLRAAAADGPGSYLLRQQAKSVSRLVNGKRVFSHHGLVVEKAQTYEAQDLGDGVIGVILADTPEPGAVATGKPTKKATKK